MICIKPVNVDGRTLPCGRCLSCRINRGQAWSARLSRELPYWNDARFITLTYDDDHLPPGNTLVKRDIQLFNKRLRKDIEERRIKYYVVGEYGERFGRAHYHGIYFGLSADDYDVIKNAWNKGIIDLGTVTEYSINYVTAYITKKLWGDVGKEVYKDKEPPFSMMSKGLGERWLNDNKVQLLQYLGIKRRGKVLPMPRYYYVKLREKDIPDELVDYLVKLRGAERDAAMECRGLGPLELAEEARKLRTQVRYELTARKQIDDDKRGISLNRLLV